MTRHNERHHAFDIGLPRGRSLLMVAPRPWWRQVAFLLILLIVAVALSLIYVPWQQSVNATGQVFIYKAMDRPQNIEAQIPGRLSRWFVQEGQSVREGAKIAELEDIDSKFLDPQQPRRLREQRQALVAQRAAAESRVKALQNQYNALTRSRNAAVPREKEVAMQAEDQYRAAKETLRATEQTLSIARDALVPQARERLLQAGETLKREEQGLRAAQERQKVAQFQRERIRELFKKELRSKRDDEVAEQDMVVAQTAVEQAAAALEVAKRGVNVSRLELDSALLRQEQATADVARTVASAEQARRGTTVGDLSASRVDADTAAQLNVVESSLASARETIASITNNIIKLDVDLNNLNARTRQQVVTAPRSGRVVRLMKVGAGETVKAGDVLAVLAPDTHDQAVELFLSDNDAPLVRVGDKVRLQFAGFPALQFTGWPSVAVGTFAGEVSVIDAVDDGTSDFRIIVRPDTKTINATKDEPWPSPEQVRPGAKVVGWVMLRQVPLGFELWRQFNAFPPTVDRPPVGKSKGKSDKDGKSDKGGKDEGDKEKSGVKRKAKYKL